MNVITTSFDALPFFTVKVIVSSLFVTSVFTVIAPSFTSNDL